MLSPGTGEEGDASRTEEHADNRHGQIVHPTAHPGEGEATEDCSISGSSVKVLRRRFLGIFFTNVCFQNGNFNNNNAWLYYVEYKEKHASW